MAAKVTVIGIGPGHPDYLLPVAKRAMRAAQVLIGSKRALSTFARPGQVQIEITGRLEEVITAVNEYRLTAPVAVLVSGDPGFYSLLPYLRQHLTADDLEVIPGVSALQIAFCRLKTAWQDADLLSLHGRDWESVRLRLTKPAKVAFLTDREHTPARIAGLLLQAGWPDCPVFLAENLSYPAERVIWTDLRSAAAEQGFAHSVMVVLGSA